MAKSYFNPQDPSSLAQRLIPERNPNRQRLTAADVRLLPSSPPPPPKKTKKTKPPDKPPAQKSTPTAVGQTRGPTEGSDRHLHHPESSYGRCDSGINVSREKQGGKPLQKQKTTGNTWAWNVFGWGK